MARVKEFDEKEALQKALGVFWHKGFEGTSIQDIVDATGVQRQSLYDTFGDKSALYVRALQAYLEQGQAFIDQLEAPAKSPLRVLRDSMLALADDACERGCALVNAAMENTRNPKVERCIQENIARTERAFVDLLERARAAGELAEHVRIKDSARALVTLTWGLRAVGRAAHDAAWLRSAVDQTVAQLRAR